MELLKFLAQENLENEPSKIANFWHSDKHEIPASPGVYILIAKKGIKFRYPKGKNSIYYIGQTTSLRKRIVEQHRKFHSHVRDNRRLAECLYEARHEYGGEFGGRYCYVQTWKGVSPKKLEKLIIRAFMKSYHAPPVANGAGVWGWVKTVLKK
jgi:hypothetical protein